MDLLVLAPHPDDAEICCGGLIAKMAAAGRRVGIVDMTRGELASRGTPETRADEVSASSGVLGLAFRENLALPDGGILSVDPEPAAENSQTRTVVRALRKIRPEILAIPYSKGRHPDHSAASTLLTRSVFYAGLKNFAAEDGERFQPTQVLYYQMRYPMQPSFIVDTSEHFETKMKSIRCFESQVRAVSGPETLVSSSLSLSSIEARDGYFGAMIGARFGEAYLTSNAIRIDDPVQFFSSSPNTGALFFPGEV